MDQEKISPFEFSCWLDHVTRFYLKLNDNQRNEALSSLISISGPNQMLVLTELVPSLVFRDFVYFLPSELLIAILKLLDGKDLLSCCQVSKCWKERIDNLTDLWGYKAKQLGVVIPPAIPPTEISSEDLTSPTESASSHHLSALADDSHLAVTELPSRGKLYKHLYMKALKFIRGLKSGLSLSIIPGFVYTGSSRRINSVMFHGDHIFIGSDNQVQIRSVPEGQLVSSIATHSVCDMIVKQSTIYTASFNANLESWDLDTGAGKHTFCGHTSAVLSVDVSEDERFVLTGSVDKTAKLWDQSGRNVELIITLGSVHRDWVFKVKFITCESDSINFITCDSTCIQIWMYDVHSQQASSNGIFAERGKEFISVSFERRPSLKLFASAWSETKSKSTFLMFEIMENRIKSRDKWHIPEKIKAQILAVGLRFMLVMCSISRKDFFLLDMHSKSCLARISTPDCLLTRNKSTVTICDPSWLDGFDFDHLQPGMPLFAACVDRHSVMLGSWNTYLQNGPVEN